MLEFEMGDFSGVQCNQVHPLKKSFSPGELIFIVCRSVVILEDSWRVITLLRVSVHSYVHRSYA